MQYDSYVAISSRKLLNLPEPTRNFANILIVNGTGSGAGTKKELLQIFALQFAVFIQVVVFAERH